MQKKKVTRPPKTIYAPAYRVLLDILRARRKAAKLTQRALAEKLGVPHTWVAKVEIGERRLDVLEMIRVLRVLGADPVAVVRTLVEAERESG